MMQESIQVNPINIPFLSLNCTQTEPVTAPWLQKSKLSTFLGNVMSTQMHWQGLVRENVSFVCTS